MPHSSLPQYLEPLITPGMVLQNKYVIERKLDSGGMGQIFLATQRPFQRSLAIKVMHRDHVDNEVLVHRFLQEAHAVTSLSHPNTVTVFDVGSTDKGLLYLVMEFVRGITLGDLIRQQGPLPLEDAIAFTIQIAQSLGEAHHKGVVHRDLKPDNIMVVDSGATDPFVKVLDFGLAKLQGQTSDITDAGNIIGTPRYMAPEQARNQSVDGRADIYSLGCCLFEMLTGHPPFDADSVVALLMAHQEDPIPDLPESLPRALNQTIKQCLSKDPSGRPSSTSELTASLLRSFASPPQKERVPTSPPPDFPVEPTRPQTFSETLHGPLSISDERVPTLHQRRPGTPTPDAGPSTPSPSPEGPDQPGPSPLRRYALISLGVFALAAAIALGVAWAGSEETRVLELSSDPTEATVYLGDRPIGQTPMEILATIDAPLLLTFNKPGYHSYQWTTEALDDDGDPRLFALLTPQAQNRTRESQRIPVVVDATDSPEQVRQLGFYSYFSVPLLPDLPGSHGVEP